jgi:hypothetical protein
LRSSEKRIKNTNFGIVLESLVILVWPLGTLKSLGIFYVMSIGKFRQWSFGKFLPFWFVLPKKMWQACSGVTPDPEWLFVQSQLWPTASTACS